MTQLDFTVYPPVYSIQVNRGTAPWEVGFQYRYPRPEWAVEWVFRHIHGKFHQ